MNATKMAPRRRGRVSSGVRVTRRNLRFAESQFRTAPRMPAEPKPPASSTPTVQRWFERAGWFLFLLVGLWVFGLSACGPMRARPDLRTSTLTQPSATCVHGHRTEQVGTMGLYGTPVVLVTAKRCDQPAKNSQQVGHDR